MEQKVKKAMVLAAGLGTRLRPLTDHKPKALVQVGGKTMLEHTLELLKKEGFGFIVVNVHHFADQIKDYLRQNNNFGLHIEISDESQALLDTGGAIKKAFPLFGEDPFLIHNVDIYSNANLSELYDKAAHGNAEAVLLTSDRESSRKLLFAEGENRLCGWKNLKTGETKLPWGDNTPAESKELAFSGIHVITPALCSQMSAWPDKFSIIDFYLSCCAAHNIISATQPSLTLTDMGKIETIEGYKA